MPKNQGGLDNNLLAAFGLSGTTGKRIASGNSTTAPSGVFTVNNLAFKPSLIIIIGKFYNSADLNRWNHRGVIYNPSQSIVTHATYDNFNHRYENSNYAESHTYTENIDNTNITLTATGFTYNTGYSFDGGAGTSFMWIAIE